LFFNNTCCRIAVVLECGVQRQESYRLEEFCNVFAASVKGKDFVKFNDPLPPQKRLSVVTRLDRFGESNTIVFLAYHVFVRNLSVAQLPRADKWFKGTIVLVLYYLFSQDTSVAPSVSAPVNCAVCEGINKSDGQVAPGCAVECAGPTDRAFGQKAMSNGFVSRFLVSAFRHTYIYSTMGTNNVSVVASANGCASGPD